MTVVGIQEYLVLHIVSDFGELVSHQRLYTRLYVYQYVFHWCILLLILQQMEVVYL